MELINLKELFGIGFMFTLRIARPLLFQDQIVPLCIVGCLAQVNKFCACYEAIERRNQNGATIQDMVIVFLLFFSISFV